MKFFTPRRLLMFTTLAVVMSMVVANSAFAQVDGFAKVQSNISKDIAILPKLISVIAYVIAAFFAATGLLKLRDWIMDSNKNSLNPALFRLAVASLLIALPHVSMVINTVLFGSKSSGETIGVNSSNGIKMHSLNAFPSSGSQ